MATKYKTGSTTKPSGLTITRDGNLKFIVSWKIIANNHRGGQNLRWRTWKDEKNKSKWTDVPIGTGTTSKTITLTASDYYPNSNKPKIYAFEFEIKGKREQTTETKGDDTIITNYNWSTPNSRIWKMKVPKQPSLTTDLTQSNITKFTWSGNNAKDDERPFSKFKWQTILVRASDEKNGSKLNWWTSNSGWDTESPSSDGNEPIEEDSTALAKDSYTRWFRIKSIGPAGDSEWKYVKHVYAKPRQPQIKSITAKHTAGNTNVVVTWTASSNAAYPIDETDVEYAFNSAPTYSGSGSTGASSSDTSGTDAANFMISEQAGEDECLFVRVKAKHDTDVNTGNWTASPWRIADYGTLKAPTNLEATLTDSTHANVSVTNASQFTGAKLAIIYRGTDGKDLCVGVYPDSNTTLSSIVIPSTSERAKVKFIAYAFYGDYTMKTRKDNVHIYTIDADMTSGRVYDSVTAPSIPVAPGDVTVSLSGTEAVLRWSKTWKDSNDTELTWSTNKNAWSSTQQPSKYTLNDTTRQQWRIANITSGNVWYFRVRFIDTDGDDPIYSPYSDTVTLDLTSAPDKPVLSLSKATVKKGGEVRASWMYSCADGVKQGAAELCQVTDVDTTPVYGEAFATAETGKSKTFKTTKWPTGQYYIALRVVSKKGKPSDWSDPVPLYVGVLPTCSISATSINLDATITDEDQNERTANVLDALPLTVTVTGAKAGGRTTLIIERLDAYHVERPDGSYKDGYEGETIAIYAQDGEDEISLDKDDLIGIFDDGAKYRMIATAETGAGQSEPAELLFEVHWDHQADVPTATVEIEDGVAVITATAPESAEEGDTVDIYRLSSDNPQLIVQGGEFGTAYVDPYPAIGPHGGYRVVDVTKYGDYITEDNQPAWTDYEINLDERTGFIHFNSESIPIQYNVDLSNSWTKDFKETQYLGGTVRGDWNPAVSRNQTVNMVIPTDDMEGIKAMRRLADYPGICHVRTQDGSSFAADVQVSSDMGIAGKYESFSLSITRIEPETLDGVPYSEWIIEE